MSYEIIANYHCKCGENPLWHPTEKKFYWEDIPTGRLFRFDPATGEHECFYEDRTVGGFTFQADGSMLLFRDKGNVVVYRDGQVVKTIIDEVPDEVTTRFNDVMADPEGRVFCGTMPTKERKGRLYRLDPDGSLHLLLVEIGCSNGMGFTPDGKRMYYTDTPAQAIYVFDYDRATGALTNQQVHIDTTELDGAPDGMCMDSRGHIYGALWGGSGINHYDETGKFLEKIELPTSNITSCIFAPRGTGEALDALYVTSAGGKHPEDDGTPAGALFRLDVGTTGVPEYPSKIGM